MFDQARNPGDRKRTDAAGRANQRVGRFASVSCRRSRFQPGEHRSRMTEKQLKNLIRQPAIAHGLALEMLKIDRSGRIPFAGIASRHRPNIRRNRITSIRHACENSSFAGFAAYRAAEN